MATVRQTEKRLAVTAIWSLFGSFGLALVLSGEGHAEVLLGLGGFALIVIAFIAHVILNQYFGGGFGKGETVLGFVAFGVALLGFVIELIFDPRVGQTDLLVGLAGFAAIIACFAIYLVTKYGMKGAFSMFHQMGRH